MASLNPNSSLRPHPQRPFMGRLRGLNLEHVNFRGYSRYLECSNLVHYKRLAGPASGSVVAVMGRILDKNAG